jgi:DNA-binding NarL/FixJ family response regulator
MASTFRKVMVVDDHFVVRRGVRALIETQPHFLVVAEASNGHDALNEARLTRPDIAVVDYSLPGLNGVDLTVALKRELPHLQILIYSMHDELHIAIEALHAGARAFVPKSDTVDHLLAAVEALAIGLPYCSGVLPEALLQNYLNASPPSEVILTRREKAVLQLVAEGKKGKEIASILGIGMKTVETHRTALTRKLKLHSVSDLVRYAIRHHVIEA